MNSGQGSAVLPGASNGATGSVFNATLKGKINGIEETVHVLIDEVQFYSKEISQLKEERCELEKTLASKT